MIFSMDSGTRRGDVMRFSTARITPSEVWIPTAVEPNCGVVETHRNIKREGLNQLIINALRVFESMQRTFKIAIVFTT